MENKVFLVIEEKRDLINGVVEHKIFPCVDRQSAQIVLQKRTKRLKEDESLEVEIDTDEHFYCCPKTFVDNRYYELTIEESSLIAY